MLLLVIVAVALLPALFQGIRLSAEQSAVATATRHLNALVEEARESPSCATLASVAATRTVVTASGTSLTSSGSVTGCASKTTATLSLSVVDEAGDPLARTDARVYVP